MGQLESVSSRKRATKAPAKKVPSRPHWVPRSVGEAVSAALASATLNEKSEVLAASAQALGDRLDQCEAREAAALARELRVTLDLLLPEGDGDDYDWTAAVCATTSRDTPQSGSGDVRVAGGRGRNTTRDSADAAPAARVGRRTRDRS